MYCAALISFSAFSQPFLFCLFIFAPINIPGIPKEKSPGISLAIIKIDQFKIKSISKLRIFDHKFFFRICTYFIFGVSRSKLNFFNIFYGAMFGSIADTQYKLFKYLDISFSCFTIKDKHFTYYCFFLIKLKSDK